MQPIPTYQVSNSETGSSAISDPQSTDKAIESIHFSPSDAPSSSSKQSSLPDAALVGKRRHRQSVNSKKGTSRRARMF